MHDRDQPGTNTDSDPKALAAAFFELLASQWVVHAIHAAAALNVADALAGGAQSAAAVADRIGADPVACGRLLRALVTIGLVAQETEAGPDPAFALTPLGSLLQSGTAGSLRSPVLLSGGAEALRSWAQLPDCLRTGNTAAKLLDGVDEPFAPYDADPDRQATFDAAMAESTRHMAGAIAAAYDDGFATAHTVVDVGGGYGTLLLPILQAHPDLDGVVFDRPHCRVGAEKSIGEAGLAARYRFTGGDFFADGLPAAADIYVLKSVIHDWDDDRSTAILRRCRQAMTPTSRLLLVEVVVPDRLDPTPAHRRMVWADLRMLIATGGRERTEREYRALLAAADLRVARIVPTGAGIDVIEAVAA